MGFRILTADSESKELNKEFLKKIMDLDARSYSEEYIGELRNMEKRFEENPRSFVCVMDGDTIAGYINFFPTTPALWDSIINTSPVIRDDEIGMDPELEEVAQYLKTGENNLYILSIVIDSRYRHRKEGEEPVVSLLTKAFIGYLNKLEEEGYRINAIAATAVSEDGLRFLRERMFRLVKELEDENRLLLCDGEALRKLLRDPKAVYHKTYKDDVYLFLPYADNIKNPKLDEILCSGTERDGERIPEVAEKLLSELKSNMEYEYGPEIVSELSQNYLDSFLLLHSRDGYEDETDPTLQEHIVGEKQAFLLLLSHRESHTHVLIIFLPDYPYQTAQIEDQLSHGYLKIRRAEDIKEEEEKERMGLGAAGRYYRYMDLNDYLKETYGLLPCGEGKTVLCMSGKPSDPQEFYNILASEAYVSVHQDFYIKNKSLMQQAEESLAIYDYYDVYMSGRVVACVLRDYSALDMFERIELMATYSFISELVIFQNATLNKLNVKVSRALSQEGDVSYDYINQLYRDYAKTIKFGQTDNFKYFGTQAEAEQIRKAFANEELRNTYQEQQGFLEHMVELNNAERERRSGYFINFAATFLAIMQVRDYVVGLLEKLYTSIGERFDIPDLRILVEDSAASTFDVTILGGSGLFLLVLFLLLKRRSYLWKKRLNSSGAFSQNTHLTKDPSGKGGGL